MKKHLLSIVVAGGLVLASCGGSSSSMRQRNDALPDASATTVAGTSASSVVSSSTTSASNATSSTAVGTTVAATFPQSAPTTSSTTTSSTEPASLDQVVLAQSFSSKVSCARGGACKVGDIGPEGGIVFRIDPEGTVWLDPTTNKPALAHYWELAPKDWAGPSTSALQPLNCATTSSNLDKFYGTYDYISRYNQIELCGPKSVFALAHNYKGNRHWFAPTYDDLRHVVESGIWGDSANGQPVSAGLVDKYGYEAIRSGSALSASTPNQLFWTTEFRPCLGSKNPCPVMFTPVDGAVFPSQCPIGTTGSPSCITTLRAFTRPIHPFGFTQTYSCANSGPCVNGDLTDKGSIAFGSAFSAPQSSSAPQSASLFKVIADSTLEADSLRLTNWCNAMPTVLSSDHSSTSRIGSGPTNGQFLSDSGTGDHLPCGVMNTQLDHFEIGLNIDGSSFVPSKDELADMCSVAQRTLVNNRLFPNGGSGGSKFYDFCGLSSGAVHNSVKDDGTHTSALGLWSSSPVTASRTNAWAWSFSENRMISVPITSDNYAVLTVIRQSDQHLLPRTLPYGK